MRRDRNPVTDMEVRRTPHRDGGNAYHRCMNQLEALKQFTTVVADTGDFRQLAQFHPQDATTNPSLILKAVQKADYAPLLKETMTRFRGRPLDETMDRLLVRFGREILTLI